MRTAVSLVCLLLMVPLLGTFSAAEMTNDGTTITITGNETWDSTNPIDLDMTVSPGATLEINDATTVTEGVTITVEPDATLAINGDLLGEDLDAGLLVYDDTEINLNLSETGQVRIHLDHVIPSTAMFNITIGNETRDAVGLDQVDIPASLNGTPLVVEFDIYYFFSTQVSSVQALHSGSGSTAIIDAEDLDHIGGSLKWNTASFVLDVQGTLTVNNATIGGADLACSGTCSMSEATATGSAPIHVTDTGSLTVDASVFEGSRTDEDIIVHDTGEITYTDTSGTGGFTDAWIRLLSQRVLHTNAGNITVHATGLGYFGSTLDNLTDESGHVNFALSEHARIVEWVDGDGVYHEEDAEILLTLSTGWGDYVTTIVAPRIPVADAAVPLPYINVKSISMEDNKGYTNMGLSGDVIVENTGSAAASGVDFWCYVDGVDQDTSQLVTSLAPGETKTIYVTWRTGTVGVQSLECQPLIPSILKPILDDVTNVNGATSQDVSWTVEEEGESQPWLIFALVLLVLVAGAWVVSNQAAKAAIEKSKANQEAEPAEDKSYLEDDEIDADGVEEDDPESEESTNDVWG
ncbi:hypothetical protein N9X98_02105 [Candidatus Poseidoniales archaeon]|nr:hypothetical protein [Candidatus Poseidoniales archaeon]